MPPPYQSHEHWTGSVAKVWLTVSLDDEGIDIVSSVRTRCQRSSLGELIHQIYEPGWSRTVSSRDYGSWPMNESIYGFDVTTRRRAKSRFRSATVEGM